MRNAQCHVFMYCGEGEQNFKGINALWVGLVNTQLRPASHQYTRSNEM